MASQYSFDIVSEADAQEVDNAVNQAKKEVETRYDFKGSQTTIDLNAKEKTITIQTSDDMKLRALTEIINAKMIKRGISLKSLDYQKIETASGGSLRQIIKIKHGLESEQAKKLNLLIKELKLKVQSQIQGDAVRVTAKDKDELQTVIQALKGKDLDFPIQFTNYR